MGDSLQLTSTFKIVGKNIQPQAQFVGPHEIKVSLPEWKMPDITFTPPVFSPTFSPVFQPQISLDPKYEIRVEPASVTPIVNVHPTPLEILNKVEVPEFFPIVVESRLMAPWKMIVLVLIIQAIMLLGSIGLLLHFYSIGGWD